MTNEDPTKSIIKFGQGYSEGKIHRGTVVSVDVVKFVHIAAENTEDNILIKSLGKFIDADRSRVKYIEDKDLFWILYKKIEDELDNTSWRVTKINEDGTYNLVFKSNISSSKESLEGFELLSIPEDFLILGNKVSDKKIEKAEVVKLEKTTRTESKVFTPLFRGDAITFSENFNPDEIDPTMFVKMNDSYFAFGDMGPHQKEALRTLINKGDWEMLQPSDKTCEITSKLGPLLSFSIYIDRDKITRKKIEGRASYLPYDLNDNTKILTFFAELRYYNQNFSNATEQYHTELSEPAIFSELRDNVWEIENSSDENFYLITYIGKKITFLNGKQLYIPKKIN